MPTDNSRRMMIIRQPTNWGRKLQKTLSGWKFLTVYFQLLEQFRVLINYSIIRKSPSQVKKLKQARRTLSSRTMEVKIYDFFQLTTHLWYEKIMVKIICDYWLIIIHHHILYIIIYHNKLNLDFIQLLCQELTMMAESFLHLSNDPPTAILKPYANLIIKCYITVSNLNKTMGLLPSTRFIKLPTSLPQRGLPNYVFGSILKYRRKSRTEQVGPKCSVDVWPNEINLH